MDERDLIERCIAGREEAWSELLETYDPAIRHLARLALRSLHRPADDAEVEEVRSGVLETLLAGGSRVLRSFRWQCSFETWLRVIVRTVCLRATRRKRIDLMAVAPPAGPEAPLDRLLTNERARVVKEALDALPDRERRVLSMFFIDGRTYPEIAAELGLPIGTVATVLARTREKLRDRLRQRGI